MEIKKIPISEKKVRLWVDSLPLNEWVPYTYAQVAKKVRLAHTTVKFRLAILEALGVIEMDTRYKTKPLLKRVK